jgi:hypothetical protein
MKGSVTLSNPVLRPCPANAMSSTATLPGTSEGCGSLRGVENTTWGVMEVTREWT